MIGAGPNLSACAWIPSFVDSLVGVLGEVQHARLAKAGGPCEEQFYLLQNQLHGSLCSAAGHRWVWSRVALFLAFPLLSSLLSIFVWSFCGCRRLL